MAIWTRKNVVTHKIKLVNDWSRTERKKTSQAKCISLLLFIAVFSGKAFVDITATVKFKGYILLKEPSFCC